MNNILQVRRMKWTIGWIGAIFAFVTTITLIMMNVWVAFQTIQGVDTITYAIGFNIGSLASLFLGTTFGVLLIHSPIPNVKRIIKEANECRALGIITDAQNQKIQVVCDEALLKNKLMFKAEKDKLRKEIELIKINAGIEDAVKK